jgi:hypothetical protein
MPSLGDMVVSIRHGAKSPKKSFKSKNLNIRAFWSEVNAALGFSLPNPHPRLHVGVP